MSRTLQLNCQVFDGECSVGRIFSIQILATATVENLREAIKQKKENAFRNIDADTLELWSVSIPSNEISEALLRENTLPRDSLDSLEELGHLFPDTPAAKHLHIIVRPPAIAGLCSTVLVLYNI